MNPLLRRLRGGLSLASLGATAGALVGAVWELVSTLLGGVAINLEPLLFWTLVGAAIGGVTGLGFSALVSGGHASPTPA